MEQKIEQQESLITEFAFNLIADSEESEGFCFDIRCIDDSSKEVFTHIDKKTILDFLRDSYTKISVRTEERNDIEYSYLVAQNLLSHESIKIYGLSDHYIALLDTVYKGNELWKKLKQDPNTPLLSHEFIKHVNLTHQLYRKEEVGIAEYRRFKGDAEYRMLYGDQPHEVHINSYINDKYTRVSSLNLAKSEDVERLMTELIDWVNNTAFKNGRDIMHDIAEFHARFIKIHPFGDGNGRTARLLTNYLLIALGQSMITIPVEDKEEYCHALNYANSEDLDLSTRELEHFKEYLIEKYGDRIQGENFTSLNADRQDPSRYDALTEFLRNHQVSYSAKNCVGQILNNYGMKNIDQRIRIGRLSVEMGDE